MKYDKEASGIKIDAVITWVDGSDINWQEKINRYSDVKINFNDTKHKKRYNSIGEIDIAIKGILKYAPFIKNIYLVTDNQKPEAFDDLQSLAIANGVQLELVDHTVIFKDFEDCLPCFNSCSIGSMLFRIPNLSEHFIIFNDDTFLMRSATKTDFFINGQPIIRGQWEDFNENREFRKFYHSVLSLIGKPKDEKGISFKKFQQNSAKLAGTDNYLRRFHTPVCVRKSTLENFFKINKILKNNVKHRFRNENQFLISSLSEHLEIKNRTFHYKSNPQLTYFRSYKNLFVTRLKLKWFEIDNSKLFVTFQSLDMAEPKSLKYILNWIDHRIN
ncbi:Stealth CR1 domain-containing protein [Changchengzhania lutea]|uniref:Stealth CR1 domain-containing protein n=1 Tax=Changchengzhania lutea TaxID=2049305 RepID=UPI00115C642C|nr:Stealth CR1 domain-containing protein [Changchengzhania lutea]